MKISVELKTQNDLCWSFDDTPPTVSAAGRAERVDPFPGYPHDIDLVKQNINEVTAAFPIDWPLVISVFSHELIGRTNAFAQASCFDYNKKLEVPNKGGESYPRKPYIVLSGKRIPIMPAMTRYLVSHEYGHIIEDWVAFERGIKDHELLKEYAKLRNLPEEQPKSYGGGWHLTHGEIFANDFRLLICNKEPEFWPHPVPRPESIQPIVDWWNEAKKLTHYEN